jgi:hypothetical protein
MSVVVAAPCMYRLVVRVLCQADSSSLQVGPCRARGGPTLCGAIVRSSGPAGLDM